MLLIAKVALKIPNLKLVIEIELGKKEKNEHN